MSLKKIINKLDTLLTNRNTYAMTWCVDLYEDGKIIIDNSSPTEVSYGKSVAADCKVFLSKLNFERLLTGELDMVKAFQSGKLKLEGEYKKLAALHELLFNKPLSSETLAPASKYDSTPYFQSHKMPTFSTKCNLNEPRKSEAHFANL